MYVLSFISLYRQKVKDLKKQKQAKMINVQSFMTSETKREHWGSYHLHFYRRFYEHFHSCYFQTISSINTLLPCFYKCFSRLWIVKLFQLSYLYFHHNIQACGIKKQLKLKILEWTSTMECECQSKVEISFFLNCLVFDFFRFCMVIWFHSSPPQRPMTSDFEGFLSQILSISLFSYLISWERASIFLFNVEC